MGGSTTKETDARLYRATRDQVTAQLANAQAAAVTAKAKAARYGRLQNADAVARQDVDARDGGHIDALRGLLADGIVPAAERGTSS